MKRKHIQLCLDIILGIGILTLMNKQLFGLLYHEIAGVTLVLVMIAHIVINLKAIRGMAKNFRKIPVSARLCLIVDILLLVAFAADGFSGVMISKKLFSGISGGGFGFKALHYFSAAMVIILLGIHVGLHIGRKRLPKKAVAALLAVALVCAGFGIAQSSFTRWASMPFSSTNGMQGPEGSGAFGEQGMTGSDDHETGTQSVDGITAEATFEENASGTEESAMSTGSDQQSEGFGGGMPGGKEHTAAPFYQRVWSVLQYFGMMCAVSMVTYLIMRRKKDRTTAK